MSVRGGDLPAYTVRRSSRARRARVTIDDAGQAVVVLPHRAQARVAADIVARHAGWIERHQGRHAERRLALASRPALGAGRPLMLEGVAHDLMVVPAPAGRRRSTVELDDMRRRLVVNRAAADARPVEVILEAWLRDLARRWIAERVADRAGEMGVTPASVAIRDQRSRWGSASPRGALSFSWRLVLCPPWVLEYVVVHELAHLRVAGHSPRFWALVARHNADPAAARRWLRENHGQVRHALD